MRIDPTELREGLRATRPYLLSHHTPAEWDRCHRITIGDRTVRVCARCLGIYPGIVTGVVLAALLSPSITVVIVAIGPLPALVDWTLTGLTTRSGRNVVRTATGAILGIAYGMGLVGLVLDRSLVVLAVGLTYVALAVTMLVVVHRNG